ncbi:MAG: hypothetical protein Q9183_002941 [Haloplaca sp. 2 TL-2023]
MADAEKRINEALEEIGDLANILPGLRGDQQKARVNSLINHRFEDIVKLSKTASSSVGTRRLIQHIINLRKSTACGDEIFQSKSSDTIDDLISQLEGRMEVPTNVAADLTIPIKSCEKPEDTWAASDGYTLQLSVTRCGNLNLSVGEDVERLLVFQNPSETPTLAVWSERHPTLVRVIPVYDLFLEDRCIKIQHVDAEGARNTLRNVVAKGFTEVKIL